jgi:hypothetical protein
VLLEPSTHPAPAFRGPLLDPGWLFLVAGTVLIAATVLIPAQRELDQVRFAVTKAQAAAAHRGERLGNYQQYLSDVQSGNESTVRSLAAMQLNQAPEGTDVLVPSGDIQHRTASVFTALEPKPLKLPEPPARAPSLLEQWATDDRARLWLLAAGALLLLIGLLPPATRR